MTMHKQLLLVDFDETLFHHLKYIDWVDDFLLRRFNIGPGSFTKELDDFHGIKGENLRLYDHAGHIESITGKSWAYLSGEIEAELASTKADFCYEDAHEFIDYVHKKYPTRLLTYGNGEYQRYKVHTCRLLTKLHIPMHVVGEAKASFLARDYPEVKQGVLIDDKGPLRLPSNWTHVWLQRGKSKSSGDEVVISSLGEFKGIETELFSAR